MSNAGAFRSAIRKSQSGRRTADLSSTEHLQTFDDVRLRLSQPIQGVLDARDWSGITKLTATEPWKRFGLVCVEDNVEHGQAGEYSQPARDRICVLTHDASAFPQKSAEREMDVYWHSFSNH